MSSKWSGNVWDLDLPKPEKMVLMAMADQANHDGTNMFYSADLLSYMTGYTPRGVRKAMASLVKRGILIVATRGGGRGRLTIYEADVDLILELARHRPRKGAHRSPFSPGAGKTIQPGNSAPRSLFVKENTEQGSAETVNGVTENSAQKAPDGLYVRNQLKDPPHQPPGQPSEEDLATASNLIAERAAVVARLERMSHDKDSEQREAAGCFRREVAYAIPKEGNIVLTECLGLLDTALKDGGVRGPVAYLLKLIVNHGPGIRARQAAALQANELTEMSRREEEARQARATEHLRKLKEDPDYLAECGAHRAWVKTFLRTGHHGLASEEDKAAALADIMQNVPEETTWDRKSPA